MRYWKPGRNSDLARAPGQRRARGRAHPAAGALGSATAAGLQSRAVNLQASRGGLRSGCSLAGTLQPKPLTVAAPGLPVGAAPQALTVAAAPQALTVAAAPKPSQPRGPHS